MWALDHICRGRQGREPVLMEPPQCARHTLGVLLSIIIPVSQMRGNAEELSNFPKTYSLQVGKPESSLHGAAWDFWSWSQHCHQPAEALGKWLHLCGLPSVSPAIKWLEPVTPSNGREVPLRMRWPCWALVWEVSVAPREEVHKRQWHRLFLS